MKRLRLFFALAAAAMAAACEDPVHDGEVSALGGETTHPGPLHRPGQPCLVCHGGSGPGSPHFSIGGTVYAVKGMTDPLAGVTVTLTDANGSVRTLTSNQAGNFYVTVDDWAPAAPIHVSIAYADQTIEMKSEIGRNGSCANCHYEPPSRQSVGRVYVYTDPPEAQ